MYLAKDNGETLISHINKCLEVLDICNNFFKFEDIEYDILKKTLILHDIGKINPDIQRFFKKETKKNVDEDKKHYRHNIVGWHYTLRYLDFNTLDENVKIANLILWHHGNYNNCEKLTKEFDKLDDYISDFKVDIDNFIINNYGNIFKNVGVFHYNTYGDNFKLTSFYNPKTSFDIDNKTNFWRTIVIFCDAMASKYSQKEIDFKTLNELTIVDIPVELNKEHNFFKVDEKRSKIQFDISKNIKDNYTNLIKAPAGFGKTMIGLIWFLSKTEKNNLLWVTPTNTIADKVYETILKDLDSIGLGDKISVELFLSGERKKCNEDKTKKIINNYNSTIIVTNIDNYIKPTVDNGFADRSILIYKSDVIFDEVHDINSLECALSASFNDIMGVRNQNNTTTLLLTATPPNRFYFEGKNSKDINYLPNKNQHYPAKHDKKYKFNLVDVKVENGDDPKIYSLNSKQMDDVYTNINSNNFVHFSNNVDKVISNYVNYNKCENKFIAHGRYLEKDKTQHINEIYQNYDGRLKEPENIPLFSSKILSTACDYSVNHAIFENPDISLLLQGIGRADRWGTYKDQSVITLIFTNIDTSERLVIDNTTLVDLFKKHFKTLLDQNNNELTLNQLYDFYNKFITDFQVTKTQHNMMTDRYNTSSKFLEKIYPIYRKNDSTTKIVKKADSNKLRKTNEKHIYVSVKNISENNKWVVLPIIDYLYITDKNYKNFTQEFIKQYGNETVKYRYNTYNKTVLQDGTKVVIPTQKVKNFQEFIISAKLEDHPLPIFNKIYSQELGLHKKSNTQENEI